MYIKLNTFYVKYHNFSFSSPQYYDFSWIPQNIMIFVFDLFFSLKPVNLHVERQVGS